MYKMYTYRVVKENIVNGQQNKRTRVLSRCDQLTVGGLYMHLGSGFPGAYRILELMEVIDCE